MPFRSKTSARTSRKITGNLDKLMSSPELKDSLTHLHSTLTSIDKLLGDVQPQIGPLIGKLHDAAAELSGTATALRQIVESGGPNAGCKPARCHSADH